MSRSQYFTMTAMTGLFPSVYQDDVTLDAVQLVWSSSCIDVSCLCDIDIDCSLFVYDLWAVLALLSVNKRITYLLTWSARNELQRNKIFITFEMDPDFHF